MTSDQKFTLLISGLGLIFLVMTAILGMIVKATMKWTKTEDTLTNLVDDVRELIVRKDQDHAAIRREVAEKQAAGDRTHDEFRERLTWLERRELDQRRKEAAHHD